VYIEVTEPLHTMLIRMQEGRRKQGRVTELLRGNRCSVLDAL